MCSQVRKHPWRNRGDREEFHLREGLDAVDPELVGVHHGDVGGPKKA